MPTKPATYRRTVRRAAPRPSAARRGYDARWRRASKTFLQRRPLCSDCERGGQLRPAAVVDHVVPHRGNQELFWDERNWQPLCKFHHDRKTALEDGGLGRPPARPGSV